MLVRCSKIQKTKLSQLSCNRCYIICLSQTSKTNFTQWLNSPGPISRHSLLTAPWATCMCALCVCLCVQTVCVCYCAFCSTVVLDLAGGKRLGVCNNASQPNMENVLPASSNIFSNTLHSFLTCTTTSARTTLPHSLCLTPAALQVFSHTHSHTLSLYCSFMVLFMHKNFTMHLFAACVFLGVTQQQDLQLQGVN